MHLYIALILYYVVLIMYYTEYYIVEIFYVNIILNYCILYLYNWSKIKNNTIIIARTVRAREVRKIRLSAPAEIDQLHANEKAATNINLLFVANYGYDLQPPSSHQYQSGAPSSIAIAAAIGKLRYCPHHRSRQQRETVNQLLLYCCLATGCYCNA